MWKATGDGCSVGDCGDNNLATGVATMAGAAGGGLLGALIGASLPAGPRWIEMAGERPIRVGSFDLRPTIRVSLDERSR
jgi:hypothetical protein